MQLILYLPMEARLAILFVLGCCAGALVNLGIYRLAWHTRPISPWSRPPAEAPRRTLLDHVPVIGWLGLRREAGLYGTSFWVWFRPLLVELFTGTVFAALYWWEIEKQGLVPNGLFWFPDLASDLVALRHQQYVAHIVLFCFMLTAFWIDADEKSIPDGVTIPGTLLGLIIVAFWPYALLQESPINCNHPTGRPMALPVWLTSPDEAPQLDVVSATPPPPCFVMPWTRSDVTGRAALIAAIGGFWAWCAALLPGRWSTRHGYWRAIRVFAARMVRDPLSYFLIVSGAIGSGAIAWVWSRGGGHWAGLATALMGMVVGGGLVWLIRTVASPLLGREAMGFGDVTLMAMIGAFLGWQAAVIVFFLAPLYGVLIGLGRLVLHREDEIPYGPFLCVATATTVLVWPKLWDAVGMHYFSIGWWLLAVLLFCLVMLAALLVPIHWLVERMRGAGSREPGARSREHAAGSTEHGARSKKKATKHGK